MPSPIDHSILTESAIECLSDGEVACLGNTIRSLCDDYCTYPDRELEHDVTYPYICKVDGIPFHYIPNEPVECNNWRVENKDGESRLVPLPLPENIHHRHCSVAFLFYIRNVVQALADNHAEDAAKYLGCLFHVLEDNTFLLHLLEGPDGTDILALDQLIPPIDQPYIIPSISIGGDTKPNISPEVKRSYKPLLLGITPEEASFHLYSRFCDTIKANRFHLIPMVYAIFQGDENAIAYHRDAMAKRTVFLVADALHTILAISSRNFNPDEISSLTEVPLTSVRMVKRSRILSRPYRFTPFVKGHCLDGNRRLVPLMIRNDDVTISEFDDGFGMGASPDFLVEYTIPENIYTQLRGRLGLHPELGHKGHVQVDWQLNGRTLWKQELSECHPSGAFGLDILEGGTLVLHGQALTKDPFAEDNNLVLGAPVLIRTPIL